MTKSNAAENSSSALLTGVRAILPLAVGIFPFGLAYGAAVAQSGIPDWVGGAASAIMLAGVAQLAWVELIDQGTPALIAVATALVINTRFVMYSAALAPSFMEFPARLRVPLAHLMTDQVAVTSILHNETETDHLRQLRYYVGAGLTFASSWLGGTWCGILAGAGIPDSWQVGFAIPLMFLALLIPSVRSRSGMVTAVVAAGVTFMANGLPFGLGFIVGAMVGIAAGLAVTE